MRSSTWLHECLDVCSWQGCMIECLFGCALIYMVARWNDCLDVHSSTWLHDGTNVWMCAHLHGCMIEWMFGCALVHMVAWMFGCPLEGCMIECLFGCMLTSTWLHEMERQFRCALICMVACWIECLDVDSSTWLNYGWMTVWMSIHMMTAWSPVWLFALDYAMTPPTWSNYVPDYCKIHNSLGSRS